MSIAAMIFNIVQVPMYCFGCPGCWAWFLFQLRIFWSGVIKQRGDTRTHSLRSLSASPSVCFHYAVGTGTVVNIARAAILTFTCCLENEGEGMAKCQVSQVLRCEKAKRGAPA